MPSKLVHYFLTLFSPLKKIETPKELEEFLRVALAKGTGELIMKYSQKRLGRLHYSLIKDEHYSQDLILCQMKLHAEILSDIGVLLAKLLHLDSIDKSIKLKNLLRENHENYILTAPGKVQKKSFITDQHFLKNDTELRELAQKTGTFLFKLLPMTDDMFTTNAAIFQGQVRLLYIHILQKFSKKASLPKLRKCLKK